MTWSTISSRAVSLEAATFPTHTFIYLSFFLNTCCFFLEKKCNRKTAGKQTTGLYLLLMFTFCSILFQCAFTHHNPVCMTFTWILSVLLWEFAEQEQPPSRAVFSFATIPTFPEHLAATQPYAATHRLEQTEGFLHSYSMWQNGWVD